MFQERTIVDNELYYREYEQDLDERAEQEAAEPITLVGYAQMAYNEGVYDGRDGKEEDYCPFDLSPDLRDAWLLGREYGLAQREADPV